MPHLGEVVNFANGILESVEGAVRGTYVVRMQTVQKIWTGEMWVEFGSDECAETLRKILESK